MRLNHLIFFLLSLSIIQTYSQDCNGLNIKIDSEYAYINDELNIEMPFNDSWGIVFENQKAIVAFLQNENGTANAGILKNRNPYYIQSAHEINENLINQLMAQMEIRFYDLELSNVWLKNIPVKQIEYKHTIYNLGDSHSLSGVMYMILKGSQTYVFMFNSLSEIADCNLLFFSNIMKNTHFGQDWFYKH